jgi:hypothetical protein
MIAHVAGLPLEELLALGPGAGTLLFWLRLRVRQARKLDRRAAIHDHAQAR